jgi:glycogen operon protein
MVRFAGDAIDELDERGEPIRDDTFLLLLNAEAKPLSFTLPMREASLRWDRILDTSAATPFDVLHLAGNRYHVAHHALALLRLRGATQHGVPR